MFLLDKFKKKKKLKKVIVNTKEKCDIMEDFVMINNKSQDNLSQCSTEYCTEDDLSQCSTEFYEDSNISDNYNDDHYNYPKGDSYIDSNYDLYDDSNEESCEDFYDSEDLYDSEDDVSDTDNKSINSKHLLKNKAKADKKYRHEQQIINMYKNMSIKLSEIEDNPKDEILCVICLDKEKEYAYVPCGHMCVCVACKNLLKKCPICRGRYTSCIKIFD